MAPYSIITYDSRSGSTLLASYLNQIEGIYLIHETNFISRLIVDFSLPVPTENITALIDFLLNEKQFRELGIDNNKFRKSLLKNCSDNRLSLNQIILSVIEQFNPRDHQHVVLKSGDTYEFINRLPSEMNDIKLIHIIRDGRAVFSSKKCSTTTKGRKFSTDVFSSCKRWKKQFNHVTKNRFYMVRYEDLLSNKQDVLDNICLYIEIPPCHRKISKSVDDYKSMIGSSQAHLHSNLGEPDPTRVSQWMQSLTKNEIIAYDFYSKDELVANGYEITDSYRFADKKEIAIAVTLSILTHVVSVMNNIINQMRDGNLFYRVKYKIKSYK